MAKQKFELNSSIVSNEIDKNTPESKSLERNIGEDNSNRVTLNFATNKEFRSKFKTWCAKKDLSMIEALEKAFELLRNKYGD